MLDCGWTKYMPYITHGAASTTLNLAFKCSNGNALLMQIYLL